jgi:hypothetical protein
VRSIIRMGRGCSTVADDTDSSLKKSEPMVGEDLRKCEDRVQLVANFGLQNMVNVW